MPKRKRDEQPDVDALVAEMKRLKDQIATMQKDREKVEKEPSDSEENNSDEEDGEGESKFSKIVTLYRDSQ